MCGPRRVGRVGGGGGGGGGVVFLGEVVVVVVWRDGVEKKGANKYCTFERKKCVSRARYLFEVRMSLRGHSTRYYLQTHDIAPWTFTTQERHNRSEQSHLALLCSQRPHYP